MAKKAIILDEVNYETPPIAKQIFRQYINNITDEPSIFPAQNVVLLIAYTGYSPVPTM